MADLRFPTKKQAGQGICFFVVICLAYGLIWEVPRKQVDLSRDRLTAKESIDAETAARNGWSQLLVGSFVAFGAFTTWKNLQENQNKNRDDARNAERNFRALQEKQDRDAAHAEKNLQALLEKNTADRFSKAIEQLGNENIHVRLGGIFALEQIANTEDKYYWQIMEILTAYVRTRSPWPPPLIISEDPSQPNLAIVENPVNFSGSLKPDIQAVMTVLARRKYNYQNGEQYQLDLNTTDLRNLQLIPDAKLQGVNFQRSCLKGAYLAGVNLEGANLRSADLEKAGLWDANLKKTLLWDANLKEAYLDEATLQGADLRRSCLEGTYLERTHLEDTKLHGANLQGAMLIDAFLQRAQLQRAQLGDADLGGAQLQGARLNSANLHETSFYGADCQWANFTGAKFSNTNFDQAILASSNISDGHNAIGLPPEESGVVSYCQAVLPSYLRQINSNPLDHPSP